MKFIAPILCVALLFVSCQSMSDSSVQETFDKNSQTVMAVLEGFQNESIDYSVYAEDFLSFSTAFGGPDTIRLEDMMKRDKDGWASYDFELVTDPLNLLQGVSRESGKPDGSVRYYADWKVTKPATDSTEARSGVISVYESFDFDADGKIVNQVAYGDFGGLSKHLSKKDVMLAEADE